MLYTAEELSRIEGTRSQLEAHQQLPRLRRAGQRIVRHYPPRNDRELLRRFDLGQYGRVAEYVVRAIDLTAEADGIISPRAYRKVKHNGTTTFFSRTIGPGEARLTLDTLNQIEARNDVSPSEEVPPYLGVYKDVQSKSVFDKEGVIGLVTIADRYSDISRLAVAAEVFDELPEGDRDNFEIFTGRIAAYSGISAMLNPLR